MARCSFVPLVALLAGVAAFAGAEDRVVKESFGSGGKPRSYYLYVPDSVRAEAPAPLLVLLHGSGRDGLSQMDQWKGLAKKEGLILVAPDSANPQGWSMDQDGPEFLHDLIAIIAAGHPVNDRRVYLFGHSAGAIHGLVMGLLESEYFAAVAVHAGALGPDGASQIEHAIRKIPMAMWVGTNDRLFPLPAVRATRDVLAARGFPVTLTEIKGHTHDYYSRSGEINREAWAFLRPQSLSGDPVFKKYQIIR